MNTYIDKKKRINKKFNHGQSDMKGEKIMKCHQGMFFKRKISFHSGEKSGMKKESLIRMLSDKENMKEIFLVCYTKRIQEQWIIVESIIQKLQDSKASERDFIRYWYKRHIFIRSIVLTICNKLLMEL